MLDISKDIHSLTEFKRNTTEFVSQMKESGRPVVLTVNGKAELMVQDATSYQKLLELIDRLEAIEGIRRGLNEARQGLGWPLDEVIDDIERSGGTPRNVPLL